MKRALANQTKFIVAAGAVALASLLAACGSAGGSYSLLPSSKAFSQSSRLVNDKIDVLWVVDNSTSMDPLQQNLANNFQSFISNFQTLGFDFRIAVTTSDAYLAAPSYRNDLTFSQFRDGVGSNHTGVPIITPATPYLMATFVANALEGSTGSGDERVFQSLAATFANPANAGFPRLGSFLAVVILSDEDDFTDYSRSEGSWFFGGTPDHDYADPNLVSVDSVVQGLDSLTNSTATQRNYNVSAITIMDSACLAAQQGPGKQSIMGQRYVDLVGKTNGVLGSVCDPSYAGALTNIQQRIIELSTVFTLDRTPVVSSIEVIVNGASVAQNSVNGWTYDAASNSIRFHGRSVPAQNASIVVNFDPTSIQ